MRIRFLLDENLAPRLETALRRTDAEIDIVRVGDSGAPDLEAPDPDILDYLQSTGRMLITGNRRSMPIHLAAFTAAGKHHAGIMWVRRGTRFQVLADALYLLWTASQAEEWLDRTDWLPFR